MVTIDSHVSKSWGPDPPSTNVQMPQNPQRNKALLRGYKPSLTHHHGPFCSVNHLQVLGPDSRQAVSDSSASPGTNWLHLVFLMWSPPLGVRVANIADVKSLRISGFQQQKSQQGVREV